MLRASLLALFGICISVSLTAQLFNNGGVVHIEPSATVYADMDVINAGAATMNIEGNLILTGNFANGNSANFNCPTTSTVEFRGGSTQNITSNYNTGTSDEFHNVVINKSSGANVQLLDEAHIDGTLNFTGTNNKLIIGANDLRMGPSTGATILGSSNNEYVMTASTGKVFKENLSSGYFYPVGATSGQRNAVTVTNTGSADNFGVRVLPTSHLNGGTGAQIPDNVNKTWEIQEEFPGGAAWSVRPYWLASDEAGTFDRTNCGVAYYDGSQWDLPVSFLSNALGAGTTTSPYNVTDATFTQSGFFTVGGQNLAGVLLSVRAMLGGPFNSGLGLMNDQLRTGSHIPTAEPYTAMPTFTHVGGGGESVASAASFDNSGTNNDIVDWVFVELRDGTNPATIVATKSALIQRDGDIVGAENANSTSASLWMPANSGNYHIAVRHRNHLGVRTASPQVLQEAVNNSLYNFSSATTQAVGGVQILIGSAACLYGGNVNSNTNIRATGFPSLNDYSAMLSQLGGPTGVVSGYNTSDITMDGIARATGFPTINDYSKLLFFLGSPTGVINRPF